METIIILILSSAGIIAGGKYLMKEYHNFYMQHLERTAFKRSIDTPLPYPGVGENTPYTAVHLHRTLKNIPNADGSEGRINLKTNLDKNHVNTIARLHRSGMKPTNICMEILGTKGGKQLKEIRLVIDALNETDGL